MSEPDANKIFTTLLKLEEPWFVENVEATSERVDVFVSTRAKVLPIQEARRTPRLHQVQT